MRREGQLKKNFSESSEHLNGQIHCITQIRNDAGFLCTGRTSTANWICRKNTKQEYRVPVVTFSLNRMKIISTKREMEQNIQQSLPNQKSFLNSSEALKISQEYSKQRMPSCSRSSSKKKAVKWLAEKGEVSNG
jgi:hypothetical protein